MLIVQHAVKYKQTVADRTHVFVAPGCEPKDVPIMLMERLIGTV